MHIGFTGTRSFLQISEERKNAFDEALELLKDEGYTHLHHGDCIGSDYYAHTRALIFNYNIIIHPPYIDKQRAYADKGKMPGYEGEITILDERSFHQRNQDIVKNSHILLAMPANPEVEELRSGTWSTIRFARKLGREVRIF